MAVSTLLVRVCAPHIRPARPHLAATLPPADMSTMTGADAKLATQLARLKACAATQGVVSGDASVCMQVHMQCMLPWK